MKSFFFFNSKSRCKDKGQSEKKKKKKTIKSPFKKKKYILKRERGVVSNSIDPKI